MLYIAVFAALALLRVTLGWVPQFRRPLYVLALLFLFVFAGFRFEVGCDWTGYYYQFRYDTAYAQVHDLSTAAEPIWWGMINLLKLVGADFRWLNVAAAAIFFFGVHVLARRQPDPLAFLIVLFPVLVMNLPMSGIRQGAAIGIMCIAFSAFIDRRLLAFIVLTVLAATLHSSAIMFLLLAPLVRGSGSKQRLLLTALLAIPGILVLMGTATAEIALTRYLNTGVDAYGAAYRISSLALSGLFFYLILRREWVRQFPGDYRLAMVGALGMIGLLSLLPISTVIGDRIGYYLIPIQAMIFARVPYLGFGRNGHFFIAGIYAGLTALFVTWVSVSSHYERCYEPYQNWLIEGQGASRIEYES